MSKSRAKVLVRNIRRAQQSLMSMEAELHKIRLKCKHEYVLEKGHEYICEDCLAPLTPANEIPQIGRSIL